MKKLLCFFIVLIDIVALAQLPPYVRNPLTTNSPPAATNAVMGIMQNESGYHGRWYNTWERMYQIDTNAPVKLSIGIFGDSTATGTPDCIVNALLSKYGFAGYGTWGTANHAGTYLHPTTGSYLASLTTNWITTDEYVMPPGGTIAIKRSIQPIYSTVLRVGVIGEPGAATLGVYSMQDLGPTTNYNATFAPLDTASKTGLVFSVTNTAAKWVYVLTNTSLTATGRVVAAWTLDDRQGGIVLHYMAKGGLSGERLTNTCPDVWQPIIRDMDLNLATVEWRITPAVVTNTLTWLYDKLSGTKSNKYQLDWLISANKPQYPQEVHDDEYAWVKMFCTSNQLGYFDARAALMTWSNGVYYAGDWFSDAVHPGVMANGYVGALAVRDMGLMVPWESGFDLPRSRVNRLDVGPNGIQFTGDTWADVTGTNIYERGSSLLWGESTSGRFDTYFDLRQQLRFRTITMTTTNDLLTLAPSTLPGVAAYVQNGQFKADYGIFSNLVVQANGDAFVVKNASAGVVLGLYTTAGAETLTQPSARITSDRGVYNVSYDLIVYSTAAGKGVVVKANDTNAIALKVRSFGASTNDIQRWMDPTLATTFSRVTADGSMIVPAITSSNGYFFPSNAISSWPTVPRVQGETFIGNSNGFVYMLSSKPGGTGWANTNRISHQPRWDDAVVSGLALRFGATSPQRTKIMGGIYGTGWDSNDDSDFTLQLPHGLSRTNDWFPHFYLSPHIHVSALKTNSGTNVAFVLTYQYAKQNEAFGPVYSYTNWIGFTQTNEYRYILFAHHTNDLLSGADSIVIRGNLRCITNNTGARVIVDSADFHVPRVALGSETTLTDD